jgi:Rhodanese-like domain
MKTELVLGCLVFFTAQILADDIPNRQIDYATFANQVPVVGQSRSNHRVTEDEFIQMSKDPATIVFDARSKEKYDKLHVKGAKNLSFPDITAEELAKIIPAKSTRVMIYCNNNFLNAPGAFPSKAPSASLNIHTMNALFSYGYTNVYELGPLIDIHKAKIEFEGSQQASNIDR